MAASLVGDISRYKSEIELEEVVPEEESGLALSPPPSVLECRRCDERLTNSPDELAYSDHDDEIDNTSFSSASSSSLSSDSENKAEKCGSINRCVRINSTIQLGHTACKFCIIQSVKYEFKRRGRYRRKNKKYCHYFCHVCWEDVEGRTGLKKDDELLAVNHHVVDGKKPKKVLKIFRKIKERRNSSFELNLKLRRWQASGTEAEVLKTSIVSLKLKLTAIKATEDLTAKVISNQSKRTKVLPRGNVDDVSIENTPYEKIVKLLDKRRQFLTTTEDGKLIGQKTGPQGACRFRCNGWRGRDLTPNALHWNAYGWIISYTIKDGTVLYMTSSLKHSSKLKFRKFAGPPDPQNVDERFFIKDENGNKQVLRSLIYRDQCMCYKDGDFIMKQVTLEQIEEWANDKDMDAMDGCEVDIMDPNQVVSVGDHVEDKGHYARTAENSICVDCGASKDIETSSKKNGHTCATGANAEVSELSSASSSRERTVAFRQNGVVIRKADRDTEKDITTNFDQGHQSSVGELSRVHRSSIMMRQLSSDLERECPRRWWNIFACS